MIFLCDQNQMKKIPQKNLHFFTLAYSDFRFGSKKVGSFNKTKIYSRLTLTGNLKVISGKTYRILTFTSNGQEYNFQ